MACRQPAVKLILPGASFFFFLRVTALLRSFLVEFSMAGVCENIRENISSLAKQAYYHHHYWTDFNSLIGWLSVVESEVSHQVRFGSDDSGICEEFVVWPCDTYMK
jgi:hypothetical protein